MPDQNLIQQYQDCKSRYDSLVLELNSEEATFKTLKSQLDTQLAKLNSDFKCSSLDEAKTLLSKESAQLSELIAKFNSELSVLSNDSTINLPL